MSNYNVNSFHFFFYGTIKTEISMPSSNFQIHSEAESYDYIFHQFPINNPGLCSQLVDCTTFITLYNPSFKAYKNLVKSLSFSHKYAKKGLRKIFPKTLKVLILLNNQRLLDDCSNSTRTYCSTTFTDSKCKTLLHCYRVNKFYCHFYIITRHTHFNT